MSLVFYYAPWSSATTCNWALEELGVPCEKVKVDLAAKDTHTPAFLKMNPNGKVPLLVHDGVPIFESIAILMHLGETFGVEKKLFPAPGIARSQALQWLTWIGSSVGPAVTRYLMNTSDQIPAELRNAAAADVAKKEVNALLVIANEHLAGKTWMLGDDFSLVDVHFTGLVSWISRLGFDTKTWPNIDALVKRGTARPAFAAIMAA